MKICAIFLLFLVVFSSVFTTRMRGAPKADEKKADQNTPEAKKADSKATDAKKADGKKADGKKAGGKKGDGKKENQVLRCVLEPLDQCNKYFNRGGFMCIVKNKKCVACNKENRCWDD